MFLLIFDWSVRVAQQGRMGSGLPAAEGAKGREVANSRSPVPRVFSMLSATLCFLEALS